MVLHILALCLLISDARLVLAKRAEEERPLLRALARALPRASALAAAAAAEPAWRRVQPGPLPRTPTAEERARNAAGNHCGTHQSGSKRLWKFSPKPKRLETYPQ